MKTFKDIYEFPFYQDYFVEKDGTKFYLGKIKDNKGQFVAEFLVEDNSQSNLTIDIINGNKFATKPKAICYHKEGIIYYKDGECEGKFIRIRDWGNLISSNGHNLSTEEATNIQNTFAEFIVNQLNKRIEREITKFSMDDAESYGGSLGKIPQIEGFNEVQDTGYFGYLEGFDKAFEYIVKKNLTIEQIKSYVEYCKQLDETGENTE